MSNTIAALASGRAKSGVAVIRISGEDALKVAKKIFSFKENVKAVTPKMMYFGDINAGSFTDGGFLVYFKAPHSYTGEDVAEIHCHGGLSVVDGILNCVYQKGALPAGRGEFTKRAFLNGKFSLSSAEGLIDLINAESLAEIKSAQSLMREGLNGKINALLNRLTFLLAKIDADIDFPEEGLYKLERESIDNEINEIYDSLKKLAESYKTGQLIKNGVKIAIIGKPNVGKSSLLNAILNTEKAIVSDIPGTTRDVVEGSIEYGGLKYNFYDTAGLRESGDIIEQKGIERTKKAIEDCDLIYAVLDGSVKLSALDKKILKDTENLNRIVIVNKRDILCGGGFEAFADIFVSAKNSDNIDWLLTLTKQKTANIDFSQNFDYITNQRHYICINNALNCLENATGIKKQPLEILANILKNAWDYLGEITGKTVNEDIVSMIFEKFCVGK